jgi:release factor glutamine methyltransferase
VRRQSLRLAVMEAERMLAAAGVASPRVDAELLAAHVIGVPRGQLLLQPLVHNAQVEELFELVARRAARIPLQHLLGGAVLGPVTVAVGPGVFTPRPETELLLEWGLAAVAESSAPLVVDLCTGSAALAIAVAASRPDAVVHAVEADSVALAWARHNITEHVAAGGTPVTLHAADVRWSDLLVELEARVDLVLCNPPYVPDGTRVPPEVANWDPPGAVFGGPDGLEIIRAVIATAAGLLRYGGQLAIEHDETQGESVPELLRRRRVLTDVAEHHDLAGRPRFATARRRGPAAADAPP